MKNNYYLNDIYKSSKKAFDSMINENKSSEEYILSIIDTLSYNNNFIILDKNNYNLEEISKLFRFYEEELKNSFSDDKKTFKVQFKCYHLIIELFTKLCDLFSYNLKRRDLINSIFQLLKESNNMLKLFIPFEEQDIKVLNNLIGRQLYYYSHIQYIKTKDKDIDYILEEYYLNTERIIHGYELSLISDFGDNTAINKNEEEMICINNLAFLLLKMIHKLNFYMPNINYEDNPNFIKIVNLFKEISKQNKRTKISSIEEFKKTLLKDFGSSSKFLENNNKYNILDRKIDLLRLNTDEYKQFIDIILSLKL